MSDTDGIPVTSRRNVLKSVGTAGFGAVSATLLDADLVHGRQPEQLESNDVDWSADGSSEDIFPLSVPDHAEAGLSDRAMERETRRTMNEQLRDAPSARYVYGIHKDTNHRHAHVALTGNEHALTWNREDLNRLRERANERFIERQRSLEREFARDRDCERDRSMDYW